MLWNFSGGEIASLLLAGLLPLVCAIIIIPILIHLDKKNHLTAIPNSRSSHVQAVSNIGGIGIFISAVIGVSSVLLFPLSNQMVVLFSTFIAIFLIGVKDDVFESGPYFKLVAQLLVAIVLTLGSGIKIESLYGLFGIYELPEYLSIGLTVLIITVIMNSVNFIDGIDGLAALIGIVGLGVAGTFFYFGGAFDFALIALAIISALAGFLRYNFSLKQKVFMGDTGSLLIGLAFSVFVLKLWSLYETVPVTWLPQNPLWVMSLVLVPVFDFIRVFLIRISNGKSPVRADRNHIHHVLVDHCHLSHKEAAWILSIISLMLMGITLILCYSQYWLLVFFWYSIIFIIHTFILHQIQKIALQKASMFPHDHLMIHKDLLNANLKKVRLLAKYRKSLVNDGHKKYA